MYIFFFLFTAWVGSIAMMGIGIYGPLIGRLYHRFGARVVSFFGSIICAASLIATSKTSNLYVMYLTYGALFGFGSCGIFLVTYIAMPRYFMKWRSLSLGLIAMGPGGGLFVMSPIVQALFERFGWRGTFLAMAGIVSLTCILAFVYRPIKVDSADRVGSNINQKQDNKFWDTSILKHKVFVLCTIAGVVIYIVHYTPSVHMVSSKHTIGTQCVSMKHTIGTQCVSMKHIIGTHCVSMKHTIGTQCVITEHTKGTQYEQREVIVILVSRSVLGKTLYYYYHTTACAASIENNIAS